ncbi:MAG TPA: SufD family Fe-S cluster assembly protein [Allosphingosinicella sp.]|jgi:Fe-S cluster assembly protein SufD
MTLTLPSKRDEAWRWSDLSALPDIAARQPSGQVPDALPWLDCAVEGPRLLFVDGKLVAAHSNLTTANIGTIQAAPADHALARLVGREGWKFRVASGHAPLGLIQIIHASTGAADHLPGEIVLDMDAQASVVETFIGEGWTNRFTQVTLLRGARLMLARRILSDGGYVSLHDRVDVGEGASFTLTTLAAGSANTRLDGQVTLSGDSAFAEAGGTLLARGRQRHDANLVLRHEQPNGASRQVWRSVADDRATCSVAARVEVARGAQKTDGEQSLKGLLLARSATINAKPELEIFADDVKCAHGATVGELNRDALFYLASRGVGEAEAKALLTSAFVQDALARIGEPAVREAFEADAQSWLAQKSFVPSEVEGRA